GGGGRRRGRPGRTRRRPPPARRAPAADSAGGSAPRGPRRTQTTVGVAAPARAWHPGRCQASDYAPAVPAPPPLRGPGERDVYLWALAVGLAAIATVVAWAAGARLGAALTYGVIVLVVVICGGVWLGGAPRRPRGGAGGGAPGRGVGGAGERSG